MMLMCSGGQDTVRQSVRQSVPCLYEVGKETCMETREKEGEGPRCMRPASILALPSPPALRSVGSLSMQEPLAHILSLCSLKKIKMVSKVLEAC